MVIALETPSVDGLGEVVGVLREWQHEGARMQLHPGDLGWFWQFGAERTAAAVRAWRRDGALVAVGMLDGPTLLRLAVAPDAQRDDDVGRQVVADVVEPARGVLPAGEASVEAWACPVVEDLLADAGWREDEPWTPLRRDLTEPVEDVPGVRIELVGRDAVGARVAVHRSAFDSRPGSGFSAERWHAMAGGLPYADARCLVAYDERDHAVAMVTVWSAGVGKPGVIEPMGVHQDHRGRGHGRTITVAAAAALRDMGASSAVVNTPSANVGGVATYVSAGFEKQREGCDRRRGA